MVAFVGTRLRPLKKPHQQGTAVFSVFNFGNCHSSITKISEDKIVQARLNRLKPGNFHDPASVSIPAYHPDVPEFREAWSRYYDAGTQVDYLAGDIIGQLQEDGLWEETIVFVWADRHLPDADRTYRRENGIRS